MLDYGKLSKIHVKNGCGKNQFTIGKFPKMSAPDTHPPHHTFPGFFPDSPLAYYQFITNKLQSPQSPTYNHNYSIA